MAYEIKGDLSVKRNITNGGSATSDSIVVGTPTGGNQGSGSINVESFFVNGVDINGNYLPLAGGTLTGQLVTIDGDVNTPAIQVGTDGEIYRDPSLGGLSLAASGIRGINLGITNANVTIFTPMTVNDTLTVDGSTIIDDTFTVNGDTSLQNLTVIAGALNAPPIRIGTDAGIYRDETNGGITLTGSDVKGLNVAMTSGNVTIFTPTIMNSTLVVTGTSTFTGTATFNDAILLSSTITTTNGALNAPAIRVGTEGGIYRDETNGGTTITGSDVKGINVGMTSGAVTIFTPLTVNDTSTFIGTATFNDAVLLSSTITTIDGSLADPAIQLGQDGGIYRDETNGGITLTGSDVKGLNVSYLSGAVTVFTPATLNDTLAVTGEATFTDNINSNGQIIAQVGSLADPSIIIGEGGLYRDTTNGGITISNSGVAGINIANDSAHVTVFGGFTTPAGLFPAGFGTAGYFLQTDGAGTLTWQPGSGGGGGSVTSIDITPGSSKITATGGPITASGAITVDVVESNLTLGNLSGTVNLASQVSGTLPVGNGGTGVATLTLGRLIVANGASAFSVAPAPVTNQFLSYNGSAYVWAAGGGSSTLAGLTDANISSPANNQYLKYQTSDSKWHNLGLSIVDDTAPTLGGNLNVGSSAIVTSSNGNINLTPNGTGMVLVNTGFSENHTSQASVSGAVTINCASGNSQQITMSGNVSSVSFTNPPASGHAFVLTLFINRGSSGNTFAWGNAALKWPGGVAGTLTGTTNAIDAFSFTTFDAGTTWRAVTTGQNFS